MVSIALSPCRRGISHGLLSRDGARLLSLKHFHRCLPNNCDDDDDAGGGGDLGMDDDDDDDGGGGNLGMEGRQRPV